MNIKRTPQPYNFKYRKGGKKKYVSLQQIKYFSKRYNRYITVKLNYESDGATSAPDINSLSWWVHDVVCETGCFDDGIPLTNIQASFILSDILRDEKQFLRSFPWLVGTFLFGGGKARENGLLWLK